MNRNGTFLHVVDSLLARHFIETLWNIDTGCKPPEKNLPGLTGTLQEV